MKQLQSILRKTQTWVNGSIFKTLCLAILFAAPITTPVSVPVLSPTTAQATSLEGGAAAAEEKFDSLFVAIRKFAGFLLLIGCVFGGIMFMTGKSNFAIMVFAGSVVVFGGSYVVSLVMEGLGVS